jgi:hypothetical protein
MAVGMVRFGPELDKSLKIYNIIVIMRFSVEKKAAERPELFPLTRERGALISE